jgi:hypothetical protein
MNENPSLNPNTDDITPYQAEDVCRIVGFESVAFGDSRHDSWPCFGFSIANRQLQPAILRAAATSTADHIGHYLTAAGLNRFGSINGIERLSKQSW